MEVLEKDFQQRIWKALLCAGKRRRYYKNMEMTLGGEKEPIDWQK